METVMLFVGGGLLAAAVVMYVLLPLVRGEHAPLHRSADEPTEKEHRRRVALSALRDVEYDYATGKLDDDDYRRLKDELSVEALRVLRDGESEADAPVPEEEPAPAASDDAIEAEIARIRRGLREGTTCRACAHVNPAGSRFCGSCGRPLGDEETDAASVGEGEAR